MAYEAYPKKNDKKPFEYNVPPIPDVGYDFKNEVNSSKNGVSYYVLEVGVTCGAFVCVTLTIFCHLTVPNKPVSDVSFYSLCIPPKVSANVGFPETGLLMMNADGNLKYTQTRMDADIDGYDDGPTHRYCGVAAQTVYWAHK